MLFTKILNICLFPISVLVVACIFLGTLTKSNQFLPFVRKVINNATLLMFTIGFSVKRVPSFLFDYHVGQKSLPNVETQKLLSRGL